MNEKGFILLGLLFMMVLMAVMALALNRSAGLQVRIAGNQIQSVQTSLGQMAAVEKAMWELTRDPCWRTSASGEDYTFNEITYNRKVRNSSVTGYTDAITVSVAAPGGLRPIRSSFRYYIYPPITGPTTDIAPRQVSRDSDDNIYFADSNNHVIYKRHAATGEITAVAGNGTNGYSGDGGLAIEAKLDKPYGVLVDSLGNIYIADNDNHCIRKVDTSGIITTVAGTGTAGSGGDGGPAVSAELNKPKGVFVDSSGNIYIADTDNHRIRKVDAATTIINTIAGTGDSGDTGDGGPAIEAELKKPHSVYVDSSGNIYIADTDNHRIRKVDAATTIINTIAGTGDSGDTGDGGPATAAKLDKPNSVFVDTLGNIYIADTNNNKIRKVAASGIITTVAGTGAAGYREDDDGGPATSAQLDKPGGVSLSGTGEIIISDTNNNCLRHVDLAGIISSLFSPSGLGLAKAQRITLDTSGNLYVADTENNRIRKLDASGKVSTAAGTGKAGYSGDGGPAINAKMNKPKGVAVDSSGNIYISDTSNHRIRKVDAATGNINTIAGTGSAGYSGDGGLATSAMLQNPRGVFVDATGDVYIADTDNHCIRKVDTATGIIVTVAGTGEPGFTGGSATIAKLNRPKGVFVDDSGNIFIADTENNRIRKVDAATGLISTLAGAGPGYTGDGGLAISATLNKPGGVFVDGPGNIFIADTENNAIRIISVHDEKINTLAGTGNSGFNGDNQPAVMAKLNKPRCTTMAAIRGGRKIYISDSENNRTRILTFKMAKELY